MLQFLRACRAPFTIDSLSALRVSVLAVALGMMQQAQAGAVFEHSRFTISGVGLTQTGENGNLDLASDSHNDGSLTTAILTNQTFTGMDRNGTTRTMSFSGENHASAEYGRLRLYAQGTVTNNYYNAGNAKADVGGVFHSDGSPDGLYSLGFAGFTDTLQFGGALQAGYQARYVFHVDGINSGIGGAADLAVGIAGNPDESFFAFDPGPFSANWATKSYPINGITPQVIHVQFSNQFNMNCYDFADGDTISGASDFSSTLTLAAIEILDANGDPVSGVTITSASGTQYPVPEPTAGLLLGLGALLMRLRRRRDPLVHG